MFTYSAIGNNTEENREHCEKITGNKIRKTPHPFLLFNKFGEVIPSEDYYLFSLVDCLGNDDLFRAVTAIRDDSDIWQWFTDGVNWVLCLGYSFCDWMIQEKHIPLISLSKAYKATLSELQQHSK